MEAKNLSEARVYVGTYRKYNNGSLGGAWLDLCDYSDHEEFLAACGELHKDESDPEFMFQDWENIPDGLIGESWISEKFFQYAEAMKDFDDDDYEAFTVWFNNSSHYNAKLDAEEAVSKFREAYVGWYKSREDFAEQLADETMEIPQHIQYYFDYERFARDLFIGDYWEEDGYVFRMM